MEEKKEPPDECDEIRKNLVQNSARYDFYRIFALTSHKLTQSFHNVLDILVGILVVPLQVRLWGTRDKAVSLICSWDSLAALSAAMYWGGSASAGRASSDRLEPAVIGAVL
jgi:hypothetical protein